MKKFFIRVFFLFVLPLVGMGAIILLPQPEQTGALRIIFKHTILADTKSPKIVLVGGSNLIYGMDSAAIHERFHIPVVNMSTQRGFGLGRMLDDISPFLYTGDVLLIVPEYEHFVSTWNGTSVAYDLIFGARQYRLLWSPYYELPGNFSSYLSTRLRGILLRHQNSLAAGIDYYNEYGDLVKYLGPAMPISPSGNLGVINQTYLNNFFRFVDDFTKRGITVLLSYPSFEEQWFRNNAELIQELDALLRAKENLSVISSPESFCFPADFYHDSQYHLKLEKGAVRTAQLIQDLQASGLLP